MGIFMRKKPEPRDMSADAGREKAIEDAIKSTRTAPPVETEYGPQVPKYMPIPPVPTALPSIGVEEFLSKERNKKPESKIESEPKLSADFRITIVVTADNKELMIQMVDGVADICDKYGSATIEDFKIEKMKKDA